MKEEGQPPAKPHRKSRYGCKPCKQRKVKCDETKPVCANCSKKSIKCDYGLVYATVQRATQSVEDDHVRLGETITDDERPPLPSSDAGVSRPVIPATFTVSDSTVAPVSELELIHHYTALTCYTIAEEGSPADLSLWQFKVPRIGFKYQPAMRLLLAFSAWHLRTMRPVSEAEDLILCAIDYSSQALYQFSIDLPQLDSRSYDGLFVSATLVGLCQFARGPKEGDYVAFTDKDHDGEIYRLLCGAKHIILSGKGDLGPSEEARNEMAVPPPPSKRARRELNYKPYIRRLETHIRNFAAEDSGFSKYFACVRVLEELFSNRFDTPTCRSGEAKPIFHWLFTLSEDYMAALRAKKPLALVIFAYFAVLLDDMKSLWYMQGWSRHIMTGVHKHLHRGYHEWIAWPSEVVGLNP